MYVKHHESLSQVTAGHVNTTHPAAPRLLIYAYTVHMFIGYLHLTFHRIAADSLFAQHACSKLETVLNSHIFLLSLLMMPHVTTSSMYVCHWLQ